MLGVTKTMFFMLDLSKRDVFASQQSQDLKPLWTLLRNVNLLKSQTLLIADSEESSNPWKGC